MKKQYIFLKVCLMSLSFTLTVLINSYAQPCEDFTIFCNETLFLNTSNSTNRLSSIDYVTCSEFPGQPYNAKDYIIYFSANQGDIITLENTGGKDLDLYLFEECPLVGGSRSLASCIAASENPGDESETIEIPFTGSFYISIDGFTQSEEGACVLSLQCLLDCSNVEELTCNMVKEQWTGCGPWPFPGGFYNCVDPLEYLSCSNKNLVAQSDVYSFTAPYDGAFVFNLYDMSGDNDLFLFLDYCGRTIPNLICDAYSDNNGASDETITFAMFEGETVYIIIDGPDESPYKLSIDCSSNSCNFCCDVNSDYKKCYGFEEFSLGNIIPQGSPDFTLFSPSSGSASVSSSRSLGGSKSLLIEMTDDIDLNIDRISLTPSRLEWSMYIPTGKTAAWGVETSNFQIYPIHMTFINGTAKVYRETGPSTSIEITSFTYLPNKWMKCSLIFQPLEDEIELFIDGKFIAKSIEFTQHNITDLNFYSIQNTATQYYIDNICYQEIKSNFPCPTIIEYVCANGNTFNNACEAQKSGYSPCELTEGACRPYCDDCLGCFKYIPLMNNNSTIQFTSGYCLETSTPTFRSLPITYEWSVVGNSNPMYMGGTNKNSINPIINFPNSGTFTVCQKIFNGGNLPIYECCLQINIGPCNGSGPVAYFSASGNNGVYALNSGGSINATNIEWDFSNNNVTFTSGNSNSANPSIAIPNNTCVNICLKVYNGCGMSSYCIELCNNNPTCSGSLPPAYITNAIQPIINDKTVNFNLPAPSNGQIIDFEWDFGDGSPIKTNQNVSYTYPNYGNYNVCVTVKIGCYIYCYCWCVHIKPCIPIYETNDGSLAINFTGTESLLKYTFTASENLASGNTWTVNDQPVSGGVNSLTYTFPSPGTYKVCFPYLNANGCLVYKCVDVEVGNPFNCNQIQWTYTNGGYQFTLSSASSQISWKIDETGESLGSSQISNKVLPVVPCSWKTISVRYFDGIKWRFCCLRVYICNPDECAESIYYGYAANSDQADFKLLVSAGSATDISWYFDDAPSNIVGTGEQIILPYPANCISRWISVKYKDAFGRWRICCRLIYFCNPFNCDGIISKFQPNLGHYYFELTESSATNIKWTLDDTGEDLGSGFSSLFRPVENENCKKRPVSVRYFVPGIGWKICCIYFYHCNPNLCNEKITFDNLGNQVKLTLVGNNTNISWFIDGVLIGSGNEFLTTLQTNTKVCVRYYSNQDKTWYWCCRDFTGGGNVNNLTFDIDDQVCASLNTIAKVPIRVRNFINMGLFQFSIQLPETQKGTITSIDYETIPGDFNSSIISGSNAAITWDHTTGVTLADNTIIAYLNVQIKQSFTGTSSIVFSANPVEIYAEYATGLEVTPLLSPGSYCEGNGTSKICGNISREDGQGINQVKVTIVGGNQNKTVETDISGNFCFEDLNNGVSYTITPSKDINYKNGVNTGDVSAIRKHILGLTKLNSGYKIIAGDVKNSLSVNTGDVSELRKLILGTIDKFSNRKSWEFVDKSYTFPNPTNPFAATIPSQRTIILTGNISDFDFIGIKMGDVNNSNNPSNLKNEFAENRVLTPLHINVGNAIVSANQDFKIDITTQLFNEIIAAQFSLNWDTSLVKLIELENLNSMMNIKLNENFNLNHKGKLGFAWDSDTPVSIDDDDVLFTLKMRSLSTASTGTISVTNDPVDIYAENGNGEELTVIPGIGTITVPVKEIDRDIIKLNPNPSSGLLYINNTIPIKEIKIYNSTGRIISNLMDYNYTIDLTNHPSGIYLVEIFTDTAIVHKKVIISR